MHIFIHHLPESNKTYIPFWFLSSIKLGKAIFLSFLRHNLCQTVTIIRLPELSWKQPFGSLYKQSIFYDYFTLAGEVKAQESHS